MAPRYIVKQIAGSYPLIHDVYNGDYLGSASTEGMAKVLTAILNKLETIEQSLNTIILDERNDALNDERSDALDDALDEALDETTDGSWIL